MKIRIFFIVVLCLWICGWFYYQIYKGNKLVWSNQNLRFIWTDKDGRP